MKQVLLSFFIMGLLIINGFSQSKGGLWQFEDNGADSASWDILDDIGVLMDSASYSDNSPLQEGAKYLWLDTT
ncbi:MAG: hypothetical protein KDF60_19460, partial [Calditrichaeota bacterium]|nr:hypothetical protein [Calditrichota bacterium]